MEDLKKEVKPTPVASEPKGEKYVGPDYKYGIRVPGHPDQWKPRNFDKKQREEFIQLYPEAKSWWV